MKTLGELIRLSFKRTLLLTSAIVASIPAYSCLNMGGIPFIKPSEESYKECFGKDLKETANCMRDDQWTYFNPKRSDDIIGRSVKDLLENGGDCFNYNKRHEKVAKQLGFSSHSFYVNSGVSHHIFAVMGDETGICFLDQLNEPKCYLTKNQKLQTSTNEQLKKHFKNIPINYGKCERGTIDSSSRCLQDYAQSLYKSNKEILKKHEGDFFREFYLKSGRMLGFEVYDLKLDNIENKISEVNGELEMESKVNFSQRFAVLMNEFGYCAFYEDNKPSCIKFNIRTIFKKKAKEKNKLKSQKN